MTREAAGKGAFYRLMRDWHGYLSAFAFLVLLFFAVTGVLLNHPNLFPGPGVAYVEKAFDLTPAELAQMKAAPKPGRVLADLAAKRVRLAGHYDGGGLMGESLVARLEGARGTTDIEADPATGHVQVTISPTNAVSVLNELHTGQLAGPAWKGVIDAAAGILIVMAILGYILFFALRFRLRTALILTAASLAIFAAAFAVFVR